MGKINTVTLYEYDRISYCIADNDYLEEDINGKKLNVSSNTIKELERFKDYLQIDRDSIKALNYVGIIKVGGITIEILPKFSNEVDLDKELVTINLLKMIDIAWNLNIIKPTDEYAPLHEYKGDLFEIFIYLFSNGLLNILRTKRYKDYRYIDEYLRFVKGRIDFKRYNNPAMLHTIPCVYYDRTMDNMINRTLRYVGYLISRIVVKKDNYRLLREIDSILDEVELEPITLHQVNNIRFNRLNMDLKPYIDICKRFLSSSTLSLSSSNIESFAMLIPMEALFEIFIAKVIEVNSLHKIFSNNANLRIQSKIGDLLYCNNKGYAEMRPDIVIDNDRKVIIDTKYKMLDKDQVHNKIAQQDLYQIYTYCSESNSDTAILLYPGIKDKCIKERYMLGNNRKIKLFVDTIPLDFRLTDNDEYKKFIDSLKGTLTLK